MVSNYRKMRPKMKTRHLTFHISVSRFKRCAEGWLIDCEIRQMAKTTLATRRLVLDKFAWWCEQNEVETVDTNTIRQFLHYITIPHPEGRWGNPKLSSPPKPAVAALYHRTLQACCNWLVAEEELDESPMVRIKAPIDRPDQVQPLTREQIIKLIEACKQTNAPERNSAIILLLLDTGMRVSELCSLRMGDVDLISRSFSVEGKGGKRRQGYLGAQSAKALWRYLKMVPERDPAAPLIGSLRNDGPMQRNGVQHLIHRLGEAAGITSVRVSPHTLRHTFAIMYLRNGGNQFTLMQLLGHTNVKMTSRYVAIAEADAAQQHRRCSPGDSIMKRK